MIIDVMCSIADGPLRPGALEITQLAAPLVSWSVNTRDVSEARNLPSNDLAVELHFPDDTVWTGEAYLATDVDSDDPLPSDDPLSGQPPDREFPVKVTLRGIGALSEDSFPVHADVVVQRIEALLAKHQS